MSWCMTNWSQGKAENDARALELCHASRAISILRLAVSNAPNAQGLETGWPSLLLATLIRPGGIYHHLSFLRSNHKLFFILAYDILVSKIIQYIKLSSTIMGFGISKLLIQTASIYRFMNEQHQALIWWRSPVWRDSPPPYMRRRNMSRQNAVHMMYTVYTYII